MNWKEFIQNKNRLFKKNYTAAPLYAKVVSHRITPFLVYASLKLNLKPDQVTLISLVIGWVASFLFIFPSREMVLIAALGLEGYYLFDSVDGQLARYTGQTSKTGAFFDVLLNYLVHPLPFVFIGLNQYQVTGNVGFVFCGALASLSSIWLGLMWNVRAHVLLEPLSGKGIVPARHEGEAELNPLEAGRKGKILRRIFSWLHKVCTFPTTMNLLTIFAFLEWITGRLDLYSGLLFFYSLALPFVSLSKIAKWIWTRELDTEWHRVKGD